MLCAVLEHTEEAPDTPAASSSPPRLSDSASGEADRVVTRNATADGRQQQATADRQQEQATADQQERQATRDGRQQQATTDRQQQQATCTVPQDLQSQMQQPAGVTEGAAPAQPQGGTASPVASPLHATAKLPQAWRAQLLAYALPRLLQTHVYWTSGPKQVLLAADGAVASTAPGRTSATAQLVDAGGVLGTAGHDTEAQQGARVASRQQHPVHCLARYHAAWDQPRPESYRSVFRGSGVVRPAAQAAQ